ncbi:Glycerophosphodiester phosphodiesterase GDPD4 [Capsicum baccatum]|uniref:Glycerophosphodiester phosphodiesterase GDPD4 n=1 Tax=Capsicum baccatum TaxID=33114 RepID=A0A2G2XC91_CAPBA|nr:Glycerophosphodiester phosphodiesterase GDPD4 [Capsicum baccatum]
MCTKGKCMESPGIGKLHQQTQLISESVRRVILDAKVGRSLYEKEFAKDLLSIVPGIWKLNMYGMVSLRLTIVCHNMYVYMEWDRIALTSVGPLEGIEQESAYEGLVTRAKARWKNDLSGKIDMI